MNKYTIKDLEKALDHMKNKVQANTVGLEVGDNGRIHISAHDIAQQHVLITVYRSNDEQSTKMPDITETRRL